MKTKILCRYAVMIFLPCLINATLLAQTRPATQGDARFGGTGNDGDIDEIRTARIIQTSDGGYMIGGSSNSNHSGDKTQDARGYFDYWIVKTDSKGVKQWDSTYGGIDHHDYLTCLTKGR